MHGRAVVPATVRGMKTHGTRSARKWKMKSKMSRELKEAKASWMSKVGGRFAPVCQEPTWNEHEEKMIGLVFNLEGKPRCALISKLTSDDLSEYGERSGPRELHCDGRLGVRRFDRFFPTRQDKTNHTRISREIGSKLGVQCQRKWATSVFHHRQAC